jgi:hypothetical protein
MQWMLKALFLRRDAIAAASRLECDRKGKGSLTPQSGILVIVTGYLGEKRSQLKQTTQQKSVT